jgi:hypothetical protein
MRIMLMDFNKRLLFYVVYDNIMVLNFVVVILLFLFYFNQNVTVINTIGTHSAIKARQFHH